MVDTIYFIIAFFICFFEACIFLKKVDSPYCSLWTASASIFSSYSWAGVLSVAYSAIIV